MEKREKIKKLYQKKVGPVTDEYIDSVMEDKERVEILLEEYDKERIASMNEIFGKDSSNAEFTEEELNLIEKYSIDLFNPTIIEVVRQVWENRNNTEFLNSVKEGLKVRCE